MFPVGFEPAIPASERSQTHVLDRAATGIRTILDALRMRVCDYGPGLHPIGHNLLGTHSLPALLTQHRTSDLESRENGPKVS